MGRLNNKIALITGAANGMGASHAKHFVEEGAKVLVTDVDENKGNAVADSLGDSAQFLRLDVTNQESWRTAVSAGTDLFGPIDVLINNAGAVGPPGKTLDHNEPEYRRVIEIDQHGVLYGMLAVLQQMIDAGGGSIINVSSTGGMRATDSADIGYVAAKWAVRGMSKQVALDYGPQKVRVNSVHPGGIRTSMAQGQIDAKGPEWEKALFASVPLQRIGEVEEVSKLMVFLASDESSYITGAELVVDGGQIQRI